MVPKNTFHIGETNGNTKSQNLEHVKFDQKKGIFFGKNGTYIKIGSKLVPNLENFESRKIEKK